MMADLYRLNNFNYTFTATDSSVLLSDAISAQCNAIIINASEPVFIKITNMAMQLRLALVAIL